MNRKERAKTYTDRVEWASRLLSETPGEKIGVEIGVWKADFASLMLQRNDNLKWIGVDPYFPYGKKVRKSAEWNSILARVERKMAPFGSRFTLIRKTSEEAVSLIPEIDFVFVDGNHDYEFVLRDHTLYNQKVRSGGIESGHDYDLASVKRAVDEFASKEGVSVIIEPFDPYGVYWWRKG